MQSSHDTNGVYSGAPLADISIVASILVSAGYGKLMVRCHLCKAWARALAAPPSAWLEQCPAELTEEAERAAIPSSEPG
jgi:hypothetical protein